MPQDIALNKDAATLSALQSDAVTYALAQREKDMKDAKEKIAKDLEQEHEKKKDLFTQLKDYFKPIMHTRYVKDMRRIISYLENNLYFCLEDSDRKDMFDKDSMAVNFEREEDGTLNVVYHSCGYSRDFLSMGEDSTGSYRDTVELCPTLYNKEFRIYKDIEEIQKKIEDLYARQAVITKAEKNREFDERQIRGAVAGDILKKAGVDVNAMLKNMSSSISTLAIEAK